MDRKFKQFIIVMVLVSIFLIIRGPYVFDPDGPSSFQAWNLGEEKRGLTLISISSSPRYAVIHYNNTKYEVYENEWVTIANITFKIKIYPEKEYIWAMWKN